MAMAARRLLRCAPRCAFGPRAFGAGRHRPGADRRRAVGVRHLPAQHPHQGLLLRHRRDHGRPAVGLHRLPELRPVGLLRHRRLCGRAGVHARRLQRLDGAAGAGRGHRRQCGGRGAGGLAVVLPGRLAVLRDGHLAGAADRADATAAVGRPVDGLQLGPDRLRELRSLDRGLVLGVGRHAGLVRPAGLAAGAQRRRAGAGRHPRQRVALHLPGHSDVRRSRSRC
jgi:hypothetical protein